MDGELHEPGIGPARREALAGSLATMRRAVVDHPEHATGRGVGFGRRHLVDEAGEGLDPGRGLAAAEDLGPMDVPGGEVLQGATVTFERLAEPTPTQRRAFDLIEAPIPLSLR